MEPYNSESRLLQKCPRIINIITVDHLEMLEKQDILNEAAQFIHSEIQNIQHNPLPDKPTVKDFLKGERNVPSVLTDFHSKISCSSFLRKHNVNVKRIATSLSEDLIYTVSHGKLSLQSTYLLV